MRNVTIVVPVLITSCHVSLNLETALAYVTDLGFFAEEADPHSRRMLGNIPQAFVHAAFIGAVIDYKNALKC